MTKGDCEGCDEKPTIFLTQIVNGELQAHNLCRDCPHMDELDDPAGCALADMLLKLSDKAAAESPAPASSPTPEPEPVAVVLTCGCGMSYREFEQSQRLGCPSCYETFHEPLMNTLRTTQTRGRTHRGKMPRDLREVALRRETLDRELDDAIHAENFERAARIRDLLRQLDQSGSRGAR